MENYACQIRRKSILSWKTDVAIIASVEFPYKLKRIPVYMYVFIDIDTNSSTCIMQYPPDLSVFKNCFCPACRRDASKNKP